jgi:hypothetical protein
MTTLEEIASWYQGCTLNDDWTSHNFPVWTEVLRPLCGVPINALEIGSWEGRSAVFFLNYLRNCKLTCVDTFAGSDEHHDDPEWTARLPAVERHFDANVARFKSRVEKIKAASGTALAALGIARRRFDLAYVDGSHRASDVYADGVMVWPLLKKKGIVIFDDYEWTHESDEKDRPKMGVDAFLWNFINQYAVLSRGYQMIIQKI